MSEIELKVSFDDVNLILEGVGQMPFTRVYKLIAKLQEQASSQLNDERSEVPGVTKLDTHATAER